MRDEIKKEKPVWAVVSAGTALGTASAIIDTSGYEFMQVMSHHGGTGGSRTLTIAANCGTQYGTAVTTLPDAKNITTFTSDFAGLGAPIGICGSLTHQAVIGYGTSSNSSFSVSYKLFDL